MPVEGELSVPVSLAVSVGEREDVGDAGSDDGSDAGSDGGSDAERGDGRVDGLGEVSAGAPVDGTLADVEVDGRDAGSESSEAVLDVVGEFLSRDDAPGDESEEGDEEDDYDSSGVDSREGGSVVRVRGAVVAAQLELGALELTDVTADVGSTLVHLDAVHPRVAVADETSEGWDGYGVEVATHGDEVELLVRLPADPQTVPDHTQRRILIAEDGLKK